MKLNIFTVKKIARESFVSNIGGEVDTAFCTPCVGVIIRARGEDKRGILYDIQNSLKMCALVKRMTVYLNSVKMREGLEAVNIPPEGVRLHYGSAV